ncbi:MAG: hypothetical protein ACPGOV_11035 [Magnetovibrionaceae bacterium]
MAPCPYAIEDLIAHRAPMILIDRVLDFDSEFIRTQVVITEKSPFLRAGRVPAYVAIEYMAQSIAAYSGLCAKQEGRPISIGFLLGTRNLSLKKTTFEIGNSLSVDAKSIYNDGEMGAFECQVFRHGEKVASAILNVYQPSTTRPQLNTPGHG